MRNDRTKVKEVSSEVSKYIQWIQMTRLNYEPPTDLLSKLSLVSEVKKHAKLLSKNLNDDVADNFELRIWIFISGDEDAKRIIRLMVEAFCEKN
ncbi:hypothetical protein S245_007389 [Arachis hypogaea]